jgi:hypothetical protein
MNSRFHRLLAPLRADTDPGLRRAWHRTLVFKNVGGIPAINRPRGDFPWNRGFDLFCLDEAGRPTHICKCREASNEIARGETELLEKICGEPDLAGLVPATRGVAEGGMQIQVSAYLAHRPYASVVARMSEEELLGSIGTILGGAQRISARANALRPVLARGGPTLALDCEAAESLAYLRSHQLLSETVCTRLAELLAACGRMPRQPQHGDLWPGNVLEIAGTYRIIDFETYGRVQVPLFDAFHLLRSARDIRPGAQADLQQRTWLDRLSGDASFGKAIKTIIPPLARQQGLSNDQTFGAFLFYVMDIAAWFHQRLKDHPFARPFVAELSRIDELIARRHTIWQSVENSK